jgi:perosamine synthetase
MIPVYQPYLNKENTKYAYDALESGWVTHGKYIEMCEKELAEMLKVKHVLLTNSGTSATHLVALGLQYYYREEKHQELKELIVPNNVYVAAWNSFLYSNPDIKLIPIDANPYTWNFDLATVGKHIRHSNNPAVLVVHNLGNIINVPALIREFPEATFVEDCCEGFGGIYENRNAGTESLCSSISFFGNKLITSGEGGAVITNNDKIYEYLKTLRGQGQSDEKFIHNFLGYNYRMTNIQAGLLYGQLPSVDMLRIRKYKLFKKYDNDFSNKEKLYLQCFDSSTYSACWMYGLGIKGSIYKNAEKFCADAGIETRPMFYPMSSHNHLVNYALPYGEEISGRLNEEVVILPSYPEITEEEQDYIIKKVKEYVDGI